MDVSAVDALLQQAADLIVQARTKLAEPSTPSTPTITVPAGGNLQAAIDRVTVPGTMIVLEGGDYPAVVLRGGPASLIGASQLPLGARATGENSAGYPRILAPSGGGPAVQCAPDARGWTVAHLTLVGNSSTDTVVKFGLGTENDLGLLPQGLTLDQVVIFGAPEGGTKRGVGLNAIDGTVRNSSIYDCKRVGQDTQAIGGWNGPGPYIIENCYLEGAGENVMFGGSDPRIPGLIPSDITIRNCHIAKPLAWKTIGWSEKNLLELKNARRVTIADNLLDYSWKDGQDGYAFVLTVKNQSGSAPWSTIEDVLIRRNRITHTGAGINVLGTDYAYPSGRMRNVVIAENIFEDMNPTVWGGAGRQVMIQGGPDGLVLDNNRFDGAGLNAFLQFDWVAKPSSGFVFRNNYVQQGYYGIAGSGTAPGKATLDAYAPGYLWENNTVVKGTSTRSVPYPAGTTVI